MLEREKNWCGRKGIEVLATKNEFNGGTVSQAARSEAADTSDHEQQSWRRI